MNHWYQPPEDDRRDAKNRLQRIAQEEDRQDEGRIQTWLDLARQMFDKDDDPTPSAA